MENELASSLSSLTLASSAAIVVALSLRGLTRRLFGSSAAYSLWILVPAAMLAALLPHPATRVSMGWSIGGPASALSEALLNSARHGSAGPSVVSGSAMDWQALALGIWCTGAALFVLYIALRQRAFVRSLGLLSPSQSVLRTARADACPALLGLLRPRIVLPADFRSRYTRSERLLIFSHERTHLRRGDPLCNGFVALLRCLFWFNPLAHLASSCFRLDQELACDAAVLREHPKCRRLYAGAMLKTQLADLALPIGCHWHSARGLKERVRMVQRRLPSRTRRLTGAALTALLTALVGCTTWTAQPARTLSPVSSTRLEGPALLTAQSVQVLESSSGSVVEDVHKGRLTLDKSAGLVMLSADSAYTSYELPAMLGPERVAPAHATAVGSSKINRSVYMILNGHIHVKFTSLGTPEARPQAIALDTNAAVMAREPDGRTVIRFDEGRVEFSSAASGIRISPVPHAGVRRPGMLTPNFRGADLSKVAAAVSMATHRTIILDPRVHAQVNLINATPITPEAFYQQFLAILHAHGFVAKQEDQALEVLPSEGAQ